MTAKTETGARYHVFGSVTEISYDDWATVGLFLDRVNAVIDAQT